MPAAPTAFTLHPRLAADTAVVGDLPLSRLLLMNDRRFPWLILVPRQAHAVEVFDLDADQRRQLMTEINDAARVLAALHPGYKINIGALGNLVPQLHIHVLARHAGDAAWPGPAWGSGPAEPHPPATLTTLAQGLVAHFADLVPTESANKA